MRRRGSFGALTAVAAVVVVAAAFTSAAQGTHAKRGPHPSAGGSCQLGDKGKIKHLIYLQFDNVHFLRDNPNVPSDLEQMPNLLNFIRENGTLDTNDHTILISHTGGGILSTLTGLYPDRHGQAVSNSYNFFRTDGTSGFSSTFKYWTDLTDAGNPVPPATPPGDTNYNMVNNDPVSLGGTGAVRNTPAPWVPFARAGCDVGNVGVANTVLENNTALVFRGGPTTLTAQTNVGATSANVANRGGFAAGQTITFDQDANAETAVIASIVAGSGNAGTLNLTSGLTKAHAPNTTVYGPNATDPTGDMTKVFGAGSPEWTEGADSQVSPAGTARRAKAQTDFVGIAIHCGNASTSLCVGNPNAKTDSLPDEMGGYTGFKGLFGAKYVNPAINSGSACVNDTNGPGHPIVDPFAQCGFPGFDGMYARNTLGEVAQMQENGVPITFAYISDAHDNHGNSGDIHVAYGPGEAGYVQQLRDYDKAFGDFFARLKADGITKDNTLFAITVEEGDHFAGTAPDNPACDGVHVACTYTAPGHAVTEVNGDLKRLVATYNAAHGTTATTNFSVHSDMAPNVYANKTGTAAQDQANARALEKVMSAMNVTNPLNGVKEDLFAAMADPVEMKTLHMVTADPARTPTFTPFAKGDYFLNASSTVPCAGNNLDNCLFLPAPNNFSTFAWNHGGIQPEVATTWIGWVGPGIKKGKPDKKLWTDHTDVRPTILALLGLKDSYVSDGRVVTEILKGDAVPKSLHQHHGGVERLGRLYKQLNASFGQFAADTLTASTRALASDSPGDATYTNIENDIASLTTQRDALADKIRAALYNAAFNNQKIDKRDAKAWLKQGNALLEQARELAEG
jgi:hypothetical protein